MTLRMHFCVVTLSANSFLCCGCLYHEGRISAPLASEAGAKVHGRAIHCHLPELDLRIEAENYYQDSATWVIGLPPLKDSSDHTTAYRLTVSLLLEAKEAHVQWKPQQTVVYAADGSVNAPTGIFNGPSFRDATCVTNDPVPLPKINPFLRHTGVGSAFRIFWLQYDLDGSPTNPFALDLKGFECAGRPLNLPRIEFMEKKVKNLEPFH